MINTIVFDIGRVLFEFEWDDYVRTLFDEETAKHVTNAMFGGPYWKELDRGILSVDEIVELFYSREPEYKEQIKEAFERVGECMKRRDWPIGLMDSLKEKGYKLYYLSNMSEHCLAANPSCFDFTPHMDGGIYSCHAKLIKPDPEIFRTLFEEYGLVAEDCLFIDDTAANLATAESLGMKTLLFTNKEKLFADLDKILLD